MTVFYLGALASEISHGRGWSKPPSLVTNSMVIAQPPHEYTGGNHSGLHFTWRNTIRPLKASFCFEHFPTCSLFSNQLLVDIKQLTGDSNKRAGFSLKAKAFEGSRHYSQGTAGDAQCACIVRRRCGKAQGGTAAYCQSTYTARRRPPCTNQLLACSVICPRWCDEFSRTVYH